MADMQATLHDIPGRPPLSKAPEGDNYPVSGAGDITATIPEIDGMLARGHSLGDVQEFRFVESKD